jgi:HAD superfamily hydrolase (TIGR01549 family)
MLLGIPEHQFDVLNELKQKYRLFLFSNTNEIHIKAVWEHLQQIHGKPNLNEYFEVVYLSNELGIRKPKPHSFEHIVKENQLIPQETLFIDDSPQHVEGAKKAGINALWLDLEIQDLRKLLNTQELI